MSPFSSLHVRTTLVVTEWRRDHTTCPQAQDGPEHCHHTQKYSTPFSKFWVKPGWPMIPLLHGFIQRLSFPYIFCIVHLLSIFLLWRIHCLSGCLGRTHILKNELYSLSCWWILGWPFLIVGMRHSRVWSCCLTKRLLFWRACFPEFLDGADTKCGTKWMWKTLKFVAHCKNASYFSDYLSYLCCFYGYVGPEAWWEGWSSLKMNCT